MFRKFVNKIRIRIKGKIIFNIQGILNGLSGFKRLYLQVGGTGAH